MEHGIWWGVLAASSLAVGVADLTALNLRVARGGRPEAEAAAPTRTGPETPVPAAAAPASPTAHPAPPPAFPTAHPAAPALVQPRALQTADAAPSSTPDASPTAPPTPIKPAAPTPPVQFAGLQFGSGRVTVTDGMKQSLQPMLARLRAESSIGVVVEGHADASGDPAIQVGISHERASRVAAYLVEEGIDASRIRRTALGARRSSSGADPLARRVVVRVVARDS